MKKLVYTISILLFTFSAFAQDLTDALKYSNYRLSGTARSAAMGNAFGALGGDFSSLSINPAGVAVYRSGEFTFSTSVGKVNTEGTFLGNTTSDSRYNVNIGNIGYVTTIPTGESSESGLVSLSFGLGFNRLANFTMNSLAEGSKSNHSLLAYFTENVNYSGLAPEDFDPYYERLAWDTYLINYDEQNKEYFNDITDNKYGQSQRKTADKKGYINEYLISFGANFNHKFYLGGTVGIHDVYFTENANLYEFDGQNNIPYFNNFNFNTFLKTAGNGFNIKVGAIYKPINNLRLGVAVHSPTFYRLNDLYDSGMESSITYPDGVTEHYSAKPDKSGVYDYQIETPLKAIFSGAYVIGKSGLISVDYELVDYSTAKLKNGSDGYSYHDENAVIKNAYKTVGNLHVGGEFRVNQNFSLRAGYENFPSVYKSSYLNSVNPNGDAKYSTIAGGIGFKQGGFFLDATYKRIMSEEFAKLYPGSINMAKYTGTENDFIFTLGYKF